jgi:hypothetical protein
MPSHRTACAALALASAWTASCCPTPEYDVDRHGVPRFVSTSYIDLDSLTHISLFRSSLGHDYSDEFESCRSMKHYFLSPDSSVVIRAPVTGVVFKVEEEWAGTQVHLRSIDQPAFTFIIFHIALAAPLTTGTRVAAGTVLGRHIGTQTYSDIAVQVNTPSGRRLVSYFETLTEAAFAPFQARGIESPASVIITRAQRDASPLSCSGERFQDTSGDPYPQLVAF